MKESIKNYVNKLRKSSKLIDHFCLLQNKRKGCELSEGFCENKLVWPSGDKLLDEIPLDPKLPLTESPLWNNNITDLYTNRNITFTFKPFKED